MIENELTTIFNCKNCGSNLNFNDKYCSHCGAKKITNRITFKNIILEIGERYFNVDNTLFRTIKDLTIKPAKVIDGYIQGVRKKHLNVTSYFLISFTLTAILTISSKLFIEEQVEIKSNPNTPEIISNFINLTKEYPILSYLVIIPIVALLSKLTYKNFKKYNYTEHLVINTYLLAHYTILTFIPKLILRVIGIEPQKTSSYFLIFFLFIGVYLFKSIYQQNTREISKSTFRFLGFLVLTFLIIALIGSGIQLYPKYYGN